MYYYLIVTAKQQQKDKMKHKKLEKLLKQLKESNPNIKEEYMEEVRNIFNKLYGGDKNA